MTTAAEPYSGQERRARDRSAGIQLRRRQKQPVEKTRERRRATDDGFDIAGALELHLDEIKTRRGMIALLESWLREAAATAPAERDESYVRAVERAIAAMTAAPDPLTAIAVLQRSSE
jgi:hypothetical protein